MKNTMGKRKTLIREIPWKFEMKGYKKVENSRVTDNIAKKDRILDNEETEAA